MTYLTLKQAMKDLGYECAFETFSAFKKVPYTVIAYSFNSDVMADNQNFVSVPNYQLELYCNGRDPDEEKKVENELRRLGLPFFKSSAWIEKEKLYQTVYEFQMMGEEFNERKE